MAVIELKNLKKFYKVHQKEPGLLGSLKSLVKRKYYDVKAVDNVSFEIEEGELVGFIGPNGAGKTTTLKCLSGLLYPTSGEVSVLGFNPWDRKTQFLKQISLVMGQKNQLWWDLPAIETFNLNKEIYEVPDKQYKKILDEMVQLLEVEDILKVQVRKLSLGQRMKCELIASLLHSPKVLFLDEPTIGLDVIMQKKIRDFVREYNKRYNATVILTSHYMGDVEELCQRVIIIDKGTLVFDGQLSEIIQKYADHKLVSLILNKEVDPKVVAKVFPVKEFNYPKLVLMVKREQVASLTARALQELPVADLSIEDPAIEDVIRELFTGKDYS
ncbi:ABC transporter ATP-binding protein [Patescibacteria group bacterium]|nr:ABC transporter ATP-binding protein [Patescibacteria group bacterium]MBU4467088.1 ABC transporter ATP-binding protein [Patescibacteria group bacterium]